MTMRTNPAAFRNPHTRKNKVGRILWTLVYLTLFRPTPGFMGAWRTFLLKLFGARIKHARFHSSVRVWAPWLLECGEHVWVDMNVNLYNTYGIKIADRVVISQNSFLCTASHDYTIPEYPLIGKPITIESDCWVAANVFIAPGVTIHEGSVIGACAVVTRDVPAWTVAAGNPAKPVKPRKLS